MKFDNFDSHREAFVIQSNAPHKTFRLVIYLEILCDVFDLLMVVPVDIPHTDRMEGASIAPSASSQNVYKLYLSIYFQLNPLECGGVGRLEKPFRRQTFSILVRD